MRIIRVNSIPVNKLVCLAIVICALACNKNSIDAAIGKQNPGNGYTEYLIPRDQHSARGNNLVYLEKKQMRFEALFDSSCIYSTLDAANQKDINKLYGFSDCGSNHHQNSARVGWVWNGSAIELHAYCYSAGVRSSKLMGTILPGEPATITISVQAQEYVFEWNGNKTVMKRHCGGNIIEGYQLYPYFGGDELAPHDIRVYVKNLE
jgi:hypothetical protein